MGKKTSTPTKNYGTEHKIFLVITTAAVVRGKQRVPGRATEDGLQRKSAFFYFHTSWGWFGLNYYYRRPESKKIPPVWRSVTIIACWPWDGCVLKAPTYSKRRNCLKKPNCLRLTETRTDIYSVDKFLVKQNRYNLWKLSINYRLNRIEIPKCKRSENSPFLNIEKEHHQKTYRKKGAATFYHHTLDHRTNYLQ